MPSGGSPRKRHLRDRVEPVATRRIDTSGSVGETRRQVDEGWRDAHPSRWQIRT
jgi:hypothetical protein